MIRELRRSVLSAEEARELCSCLAAEERAYRRLYRLARRQNRYLCRHDIERLEANAQEWGKYLPMATAARRARERCIAERARNLGMTAPPASGGHVWIRAATGHRAPGP